MDEGESLHLFFYYFIINIKLSQLPISNLNLILCLCSIVYYIYLVNYLYYILEKIKRIILKNKKTTKVN